MFCVNIQTHIATTPRKKKLVAICDIRILICDFKRHAGILAYFVARFLEPRWLDPRLLRFPLLYRFRFWENIFWAPYFCPPLIWARSDFQKKKKRFASQRWGPAGFYQAPSTKICGNFQHKYKATGIVNFDILAYVFQRRRPTSRRKFV